MKEQITTRDGFKVDAIFLNDYEQGKLFYVQERLVITGDNNAVIDSIDIINTIQHLRDIVDSIDEFVPSVIECQGPEQ